MRERLLHAMVLCESLTAAEWAARIGATVEETLDALIPLVDERIVALDHKQRYKLVKFGTR